MSGGNFDLNVGKIRPGTYVNVKSKRQQKAKGSTRGIAVIPFVGYDWGPNGEFIKLDNVFKVIYHNSHAVYSESLEEGQELFFRILMSRNLTPEQRADILMNGTVCMWE